MDEVLDRLRRLPETPPTAPEPLDGLRRRAQRRRHRRWAVTGLAVSLVAAGSVAGVTARISDRRPAPVAVDVGGATTTTSAPPPSTTTTAPPAITAPNRPAAWQIPASIPSSFLPGSVGAESAGEAVLVPGASDSGGLTAYDARTGAQRWRYESGTNLVIQAVGAGLVLVAPQYGGVAAVDLATGAERWRTALPAAASAGRATIDGSRIYFGASHPAEADVEAPLVLALDAATGRTLWTAALDGGTDLQPAAPVVAGDLVLVADLPSHPGSAPTSHLHALDAVTGAVRWRADLESNRPVFHEQAPIASGGTVYVTSNAGLLVALDASSGHERWRRKAPTGIATLAAVADGRVLAVVGRDVVSLDVGDGSEQWRVPTAAPGRPARSWFALTDGTLVVLEPSRTFAVDVESGRVRWELPVAAWHAKAADGTVYLAPLDRLLAVDSRTGQPEWMADTRPRRDQPTLLLAGHVAVTGEDGSLVGFPR